MEKENLWNYHYGVAAETIDEKSNKTGILKVICPELTPFYSGSVKPKEEDIVFAAEDVWGTKQASKVKTTNVIEAVYLGSTSNISMPDIHEGEQVKILQYGNDDTYYWSTFRRDENLRKREHFRISCANKSSRLGELNDNNTYYVEVDTRPGQKNITISTNKNDGESFAYKLNIDCVKNTASLNDDVGNKLFIDSNKARVLLENAEKTKVDLDGRRLIILADDIFINGRKRLMIKSPFLVIDHVKGLLKVIAAAIKNCAVSKTC